MYNSTAMQICCKNVGRFIMPSKLLHIIFILNAIFYDEFSMECLFRDKVLKPPSTLAYNFTAKDVKYVAQSPTNIIFRLLLSMAFKRRRCTIVLEEAHTFWAVVLLSSPPSPVSLLGRLYIYTSYTERRNTQRKIRKGCCVTPVGIWT
jgi:hypothetical protein